MGWFSFGECEHDWEYLYAKKKYKEYWERTGEITVDLPDEQYEHFVKKVCLDCGAIEDNTHEIEETVERWRRYSAQKRKERADRKARAEEIVSLHGE